MDDRSENWEPSRPIKALQFDCDSPDIIVDSDSCCQGQVRLTKQQSYALGLVFIVLVALIWAVSSALVQFLYESESFNSPFLLTYIGVSLFTWPLPVKFITDRVIQPCFQRTVETCNEFAQVTKDLEETCANQCHYGIMSGGVGTNNINNNATARLDESTETATTSNVVNTSIDTNIILDQHNNMNSNNINNNNTSMSHMEQGSIPNTAVDESINKPESNDHDDIIDVEYMQRTRKAKSKRWTRVQHIQAAAQIAPIWFLANWTYNASLSLTSIASSTVLMSSCSLFAFAFAVIANDENFHFIKLVGVVIGICGTGMITLHDYRRDECYTNCTNVLLGDLLALTSAVSFGFYAVQIRILCPRDEQLYSMQRLLGYIGLINTILLAPVAIYELFGNTKLTIVVFELIIVRSLFDYVLSEYLYFRSVVLTSATIATLGLALTIPFAFIADLIVRKSGIFSVWSIMGASAVILGFLMVNAGSNEQYDKKLVESLQREDLTRSNIFCHPLPCGCLVDSWMWPGGEDDSILESIGSDVQRQFQESANHIRQQLSSVPM